MAAFAAGTKVRKKASPHAHRRWIRPSTEGRRKRGPQCELLGPVLKIRLTLRPAHCQTCCQGPKRGSGGSLSSAAVRYRCTKHRQRSDTGYEHFFHFNSFLADPVQTATAVA